MLVERKEVLKEDKTVGYIEAVFSSGNILKTTYFPNAHRLYIAFSRGDTYSYGNINPELYEEFENADSHGKFFHSRLKKPDIYPTRKEFSLYPTEVSDLKQIVENNKKEDNDDE